MLTYIEFKEKVRNEFKNYLNSDYKNYTIKIEAVRKVNETLDALLIADENKKDCVVPTFYINDMYSDYIESKDYQFIFEKVADEFNKAMKNSDRLKMSVDISNFKGKIILQVVNKKENEELLKTLPHRDFLDLSIIYRYLINKDTKTGIMSAVITEPLQKLLGISEEKLYEEAFENTRKINPVTVKTMLETLSEFAGEEVKETGMPDMYVITNDIGINGANAILYNDIFKELSKKVKGDLFILPSSINELIAVPANIGDADSLRKMVYTINREQVKKSEWLSDNVYRYSAEGDRVEIA